MNSRDTDGFGITRYPLPQGAGFEDHLERLFQAVSPAWNSYRYVKKFENQTFKLVPYCNCGVCSQCSDGAPNFQFKPDGLILRWYKTPMGGILASRELDPEQFQKMIMSCVSSISETKRKKQK